MVRLISTYEILEIYDQRVLVEQIRAEWLLGTRERVIWLDEFDACYWIVGCIRVERRLKACMQTLKAAATLRTVYKKK
jgi:hypothetical protein